MNAAKWGIDFLGIGFEICLSLYFYSMFWEIRPLRKRAFAAGFCGIGILNFIGLAYYPNSLPFVVTFVLVTFLISLYFVADVTSKILFSLILSAFVIFSELFVGVVMVRVLQSPIVYVQNRNIVYAVGMVSSKLFAFTLICLVRVMVLPKGQQFGNWFNLLMLFLPVQSLIICFIVYGVAGVSDDAKVNSLSMLALLISFLLLIVVVYIIRKYTEAMEYKQKYEFAQFRLQTQIGHYHELYQAEQGIRGIRHDIKNNMIIIAGFLREGKVPEALEQVEKIQSDIQLATRTVNTGYPAIDAIINAKSKEAEAKKTEIQFKMMMDGRLYIDQSDIAMILASALDNAVEAAEKGNGEDEVIHVYVSSKADYLSIVVENGVSDAVDRELKTTKADKASHGFGIRQMKAIAAKYDGDLSADYDAKTRRFSLKILLLNRAS